MVGWVVRSFWKLFKEAVKCNHCYSGLWRKSGDLNSALSFPSRLGKLHVPQFPHVSGGSDK